MDTSSTVVALKSNKSLISRSANFWPQVVLLRGGAVSLQHQLYEQIRDGIVSGSLPSGTRLPASRALAREVACSRNTVLEVLNRLTAEDYLTSLRGSGVYVADELPDSTFSAVISTNVDTPIVASAPVQPGLSSRGMGLASAHFTAGAIRHGVFSSSIPDVDLFPIDLWTQLQAQAWRENGETLVREVDTRGYAPLREAIAEYVFAARNLSCSLDQIVVTSGAGQAIDLVGKFLLEPGDRAWVEDPGYPIIGALLKTLGANVTPIPLDAEGLDFRPYGGDPPRIIAVSPTHQFPTGIMMTNERRLDLLAYAQEVGAWIVEDDYDGEFRYAGKPLSALASARVPADGNVIYVGTFSKMMFPAIRLGYLVVPARIARDFARARSMVDIQPSILPQPALARFISEGHLATHMRRMRPIYRQRRDALIRAIATLAQDLLTINSDPAGMHLMARFTPSFAARMKDVYAAYQLKSHGLSIQPLSLLYAGARSEQGFVLGFAGADEAALTAGMETLVATLRH